MVGLQCTVMLDPRYPRQGTAPQMEREWMARFAECFAACLEDIFSKLLRWPEVLIEQPLERKGWLFKGIIEKTKDAFLMCFGSETWRRSSQLSKLNGDLVCAIKAQAEAKLGEARQQGPPGGGELGLPRARGSVCPMVGGGPGRVRCLGPTGEAASLTWVSLSQSLER